MTDRLTIELQDAELQRRLRTAIGALEHPAGLMQAIAGQMRENIERRFGTQTDPAGVPWKPLAESTLERKKGRGSILILDRIMQQSLGANVSPDGLAAEIGFGEIYAGYHETGSKDGKLPRRALLTADWKTGELGTGDREDILDLVNSYLQDLL